MGVYYGKHSPQNFLAVPVHERQSVSRGELRGVLHALLSEKFGLRSLDSRHVFKGILERSLPSMVHA